MPAVKTPYNGIAKTALKCEPFRLVIKYKNVNIWRGGFSRSLRPCLSWRDRARHLSIVCAGAAELARSLAQRPGMADSVIIREREVFATPMLREKALVQFVSQPRAMK